MTQTSVLVSNSEKMLQEISKLKRQHGALILAHNYQIPEIQDIADHVDDSLGLSQTTTRMNNKLIIFCGVHFMAETASILCPEKRILIPDPHAGCSLASSINVEELRLWKRKHPKAIVVSYVNTTADVKAESDYCCTSTNAIKVIESISKEKEILFVPDLFLGSYVAAKTGRRLHLWPGECHVHAGILPDNILAKQATHPNAEFLIHPECGCGNSSLYYLAEGDVPLKNSHVLSTSRMISYSKESPAKEFIIATETGLLHQLRKRSPQKSFYPAADGAICQYMKMITVDKVLHSLKKQVYEVKVLPSIAAKAKVAIDRMMDLT